MDEVLRMPKHFENLGTPRARRKLHVELDGTIRKYKPVQHWVFRNVLPKRRCHIPMSFPLPSRILPSITVANSTL
jgi:hypothetical protein